MEIIVGDIHSSVVTKDVRILGVVRSVCRARPKNYKHMPKYKAGHWDGYVSLMTSMTQFPTGLLDVVVDALKDKGYNPILKQSTSESQNVPVVGSADLNGIILRDYQVTAAQQLLHATRGVARMATNSGKTEVMAVLTKAIGNRTLVVLHRKELMYQTATRFHDRLGVAVGMIGDGIFDPQNITVAMIQTLHGRMSDFQSHIAANKLLMIDECHHLSSNTMMDVLYNIPGRYRFGFSGTPLTYDDLNDMKLMAITGRVVCDVSNRHLIGGGYSAHPVVEIHIIEDTDVDVYELPYQEAYTQLIVMHDYRNDVIADISNRADGVVLILVDRLDHGTQLCKRMPNAVFVHGGDTTEYRQEVLANMASVPGVYIATSIFNEGVDVPSVDTVILAAGGKSHITLLQRIGRGLRRKEGENILRVHDFLDDTNHHLLSHSKARLDVYEQEGFDIRVVEATNSHIL